VARCDCSIWQFRPISKYRARSHPTRHFAAVRRNVDAKYLQDHYHILMQATTAIGATADVDPLDRPDTFSTRQHLVEAVGASLTELGPMRASSMPHKTPEALAEREAGLSAALRFARTLSGQTVESWRCHMSKEVSGFESAVMLN
jgi:hypothetical protein